MFSIIKLALYTGIALVIYCIIQGVTAAKPEQKIKQSIEALNKQVENTVDSLFLQINDGIDELSEQTAKIIKQ